MSPPPPPCSRHCLRPRVSIVSGAKSGQPPLAQTLCGPRAPRRLSRVFALLSPTEGRQHPMIRPLTLPPNSKAPLPFPLTRRTASAPAATWLGLGLTTLANCHTLLPGCQPWRLVQTNLNLHKYPGPQSGGRDVVRQVRKFELCSKK